MNKNPFALRKPAAKRRAVSTCLREAEAASIAQKKGFAPASLRRRQEGERI